MLQQSAQSCPVSIPQLAEQEQGEISGGIGKEIGGSLGMDLGGGMGKGTLLGSRVVLN
jgi:uncharacterized protein YcfJ